ncbi:hypothetical protein BWR19_07875 [Halomonas sp. 1513]|nr:pilus assembly protein TadG-related protein [Halomonas sp. 1513]APX92854.1 hypothetical protein BWR19_07875 [Halomonas sp. 1513]
MKRLAADRPGPGGRHRQRGAIGLLGVMVLLLVVLCIVVALDTGRLYLEQQRLQRAADLAAMQAVATAGQCRAAADADQVVRQAAARHGYAEEGLVLVAVERGWLAVEEGVRVFQTSSDQIHDALRVRLEHRVPTSLIGNLDALFPGSDIARHVDLQAEAVARRTANTTLSAGTRLLHIDPEDSPLLGPLLTELLGSEVGLSLVGHQGLLDSRISLLALAEQASLLGIDATLASAEQLLDASVTLSELASASAQALAAEAGSDDVQLLLQELAAGTNLPAVRLGDLLDIAGGDEGLEANVGVASLLEAMILAANQSQGIHLDGLSLDIPSLTSVTLDLAIIQPPQIAVGPAGCADGDAAPCNAWRSEVRTAQLDLSVETELALLGLVNVDLDLNVEAASGRAGVEEIRCLGNERVRVEVGGSTSPVQMSTRVGLALLPVAEGLLRLEVNSDTQQSSTFGETSNTHIDWPGESSALLGQAPAVNPLVNQVGGLLSGLSISLALGPDAERESQCPWWRLDCLIGSVVDLLSPVLDIVNGLLGITVGSLTELADALSDALAAVAEGVLDPLLTPLLEALGIGLDEMEIELLDVNVSGVELVR